jgi:S-adenosylmethionine:tRNA ribosyltransferase-isomerase
VLDWRIVTSMAGRGVEFATITHAAGISSTGDPELDKHLPFDEPYRIPTSTASAIARTQRLGGRIIAIGTTVVRALEHAACRGGSVRPGEAIATQRIGASTQLLVVDAVLSGTHEPGTSHYDLLRAFVCEEILRRMDKELNINSYRTHEFGDSVFLERDKERSRTRLPRFMRSGMCTALPAAS